MIRRAGHRGMARRANVVRAALPTPPVAGLTLWLRADLGRAMNGGAVAALADQSGQGNHVAQATPVRQPTLVASDANLGNMPSIRFNVANNSLDMTNTPTFAWIAAVATHPGSGGSAVFPAGVFPVLLCRGGANDFLLGDATTANWATTGSALAGTRYRNGSATNVALTAVNAPHFYEFEPSAPASGALRIGGRASTILDWGGTIAEVFGMASVPNSSVKTALRAYISSRYGFSA